MTDNVDTDVGPEDSVPVDSVFGPAFVTLAVVATYVAGRTMAWPFVPKELLDLPARVDSGVALYTAYLGGGIAAIAVARGLWAVVGRFGAPLALAWLVAFVAVTAVALQSTIGALEAPRVWILARAASVGGVLLLVWIVQRYGLGNGLLVLLGVEALIPWGAQVVEQPSGWALYAGQVMLLPGLLGALARPSEPGDPDELVDRIAKPYALTALVLVAATAWYGVADVAYAFGVSFPAEGYDRLCHFGALPHQAALLAVALLAGGAVWLWARGGAPAVTRGRAAAFGALALIVAGSSVAATRWYEERPPVHPALEASAPAHRFVWSVARAEDMDSMEATFRRRIPEDVPLRFDRDLSARTLTVSVGGALGFEAATPLAGRPSRLRFALVEPVSAEQRARVLELLGDRFEPHGTMELTTYGPPSIAVRPKDGTRVAPEEVLLLVAPANDAGVLWTVQEAAEPGRYDVMALRSSDLAERVVVTRAEALFDGEQLPYVSIDFDEAYAARFGALTREIVGEHLAIVLDGVTMSAPIVQEPIAGGRVRITMGLGPEGLRQASTLANALSAPELPDGAMLVKAVPAPR